MEFFINFLLFVFVAIMGAVVGAIEFAQKLKTEGTLRIIKDPVDGDIYTALALSERDVVSLKTGDIVILKVDATPIKQSL